MFAASFRAEVKEEPRRELKASDAPPFAPPCPPAASLPRPAPTPPADAFVEFDANEGVIDREPVLDAEEEVVVVAASKENASLLPVRLPVPFKFDNDTVDEDGCSWEPNVCGFAFAFDELEGALVFQRSAKESDGIVKACSFVFVSR